MQCNNKKTESNIKHNEIEHFWRLKSNNYEIERSCSFEKKQYLLWGESFFLSYKSKIMSLLRILAKKKTSSTLTSFNQQTTSTNNQT